jgi:hypothetical protein
MALARQLLAPHAIKRSHRWMIKPLMGYVFLKNTLDVHAPSVAALMRTIIRPVGAIIRSVRNRREIVKWEKAGKPVPPPHTIKIRNILRLASMYELDTLVETGTFYGDTIAATRRYFKRIYSIEIDERLYLKARDRFASDVNVEILLGDSSVVLSGLLPRLSGKTLFWLDGHFSGGETGRGEIETPILAELNHILMHRNVRPYVVIIDDAREFGKNPHYPDLGSFLPEIEVKFGTKPTVVDDSIVIVSEELGERPTAAPKAESF